MHSAVNMFKRDRYTHIIIVDSNHRTDQLNVDVCLIVCSKLVRLMNVYRLKNNQVPVFIGVGINSGEVKRRKNIYYLF